MRKGKRAVIFRTRSWLRRALPCVAVLCLAGCGGDSPPTAPDSVAPTAPAQPSREAARIAADLAAEDVTATLARANAAFVANRLVAPAGDNALELFLAVLQTDPDNGPAREAVVELFPFGVTAARRALAAGELDEAERIIDLFGRANPDSLATNELRASLALLRARATAAAVASRAPPSAAPATPATPIAAAPSATAEGAPAPTTPARGRTTPGASTTVSTVAASPSAASSSPRTGETIDASASSAAPASASTTPSSTARPLSPPVAPILADAVVVSRVQPDYPDVARQRRMRGWVDVEFTVRVDGSVGDIRIVAAEPTRMFDNAAQRAVSRWKFRPATRDGKPEATRSRTRIAFQP
jgi:periplasmic protein TonB